MRYLTKFALFVALVTMIAGAAVAAKVKVRVEYDKTFDFRAFRTYAWHPDGAGVVKMLENTDDNPEQIRSRLEPVIRQAVDQELAKRGFTQVTSGTPDFHVCYYLLVGPGLSSQFQGQFVRPVPEWGLPSFPPSTTSLRMFEQGTLILDISSVSLNTVIWRGIVQGEIDRQRTDAERHKRIQDGVRDVLKKFPAQGRK